jgi:O-antigen ligase
MIQKKKYSSMFLDFLFFAFGVLIFLPLEIVYDGLWLSYLLIVIVFLCVGIKDLRIFILFLVYSACLCLSTLMGVFDGITSIINPIFTALILTVGPIDRKHLAIIINGIYFAAVTCVLHMVYVANQLDLFSSLFVMLTSREWGVGTVVGFGNGLAIIFSLLMLYAYRQAKYFLICIFFVGGVLTTSRIPFAALGIVFVSFILDAIKTRKINYIFFLSVVMIFFASFYLLIGSLQDSELSILEARLSTSEDRVDVYSLAWNSFFDNPIFGIGAEKLPDFEHAHNSYLQVLSKYGIVGFICWIALWYYSFLKDVNIFRNKDFIMLMLVISLFQIGLHNPNAMLLIVLYHSMFVISKRSISIKR